MAGDFTFGIEEEYFLVDAETKSVARGMPQAFFKRRARRPAAGSRGEFLQSQIEVIIVAAYQHGRGARRAARPAPDRWRRSPPSTASPSWPPARIRPRSGATSMQTPKERYDAVMDDLQMIGQRDMLCGMHVHVELPDPIDARRRDVPHAALPAAVPGAVDIVAVLAIAPHRPQGLSARRL